MSGSDPITENAAQSQNGWFELRASLTGMGPDDVLSVVLPAKFTYGTVSELLAYIFPTGDEEQRAVAAMFDIRANPDLPEIYAVFLDAFDQWRKGRCTLLFSGGDGADLDVSGLVSQQLEVSSAGASHQEDESHPLPPSEALPQNCHSEERSDEESGGMPPENEGGSIPLPPQILRGVYPERSRRAQDDRLQFEGVVRAGGENVSTDERQSPYPRLSIQVDQQYRATAYATQMGFWSSKQELLQWLQTLTVLYFLDKHEAAIPVPVPSDWKRGLTAAVEALQSTDLISGSLGTQTFGITEEGRGFISRLLTETESYIDLYDHFKDTSFDLDEDGLDADTLDPDTINFDTGRGVDLRVQVYLAEGLDPVRTVFLLRLYDGTLDDFVSTWEGLIDDDSFFDSILEPVVNRCEVDEAEIGRIVDSGHALLEEREERARGSESQQEIIGRVWA